MIGAGTIWQFIKWHKIFGDKLAKRLFDRPLPPATEREIALAAALREELTNAPAALMLPKWVTFREEIRRNFDAYDPRSFLRWPLIQHTMCVTNSGTIVRELIGLHASPEWPRFQRAVVESPTGNPIRCIYHPESSGNLLHHCYHAMRFEEKTGARVDQLDLVVEFGGGYGSMARLFQQLGFAGRYFIYDLPEFSALQRYFLKNLELPVREGPASAVENGLHLHIDLETLRTALAARPTQGRSAFIATWSLSESPVELREKFLPLVDSFDFFLIAFQDQFGTVNNLEWFEAFAKATADHIAWTHQPLRHIPNNNYMFGHRLCAKN